MIDVVVALVAIIVLSPVLIVVAIAIRVKLGSPVVFIQKRPGRYGKPFDFFKFRSMIDAFDKNGKALSEDERVSSFGIKLRNSSLDELPGLFNVLRGEMSLVGPRPLLMRYLPLYNAEQMRRHDVPPGITGWAQVNGRNAISWDKKFELDLYYVDNKSLWLDIKILLLTLRKVVAKDDINEGTEYAVGMEEFKGSNKEN